MMSRRGCLGCGSTVRFTLGPRPWPRSSPIWQRCWASSSMRRTARRRCSGTFSAEPPEPSSWSMRCRRRGRIALRPGDLAVAAVVARGRAGRHPPRRSGTARGRGGTAARDANPPAYRRRPQRGRQCRPRDRRAVRPRASARRPPSQLLRRRPALGSCRCTFDHEARGQQHAQSIGHPQDVDVGAVPARAVVAELGRAEKLIYGRSSRRLDVTRARGVQHALMWAQYAPATPPSRWQDPDH